MTLRKNLIALETLPLLPVAEVVNLEANFDWKTPARCQGSEGARLTSDFHYQLMGQKSQQPSRWRLLS